ncbi:MAG: nucleotidyltransferase domain-containing protein [Pyrinomonadaceae bacterium]
MKVAVLKKQMQPICVEEDIEMLGVFGSVARGEDDAGSAADLLVRFKNPVGLMQLIGLEQRIEGVLGRQVDVGTEARLHPLIKDRVKKDLMIIYEG